MIARETLTWPRYMRLWLIGLALVAGAAVLSMYLGADVQRRGGWLPVEWGWPGPEVWHFRWYRVLSAALVGFALAASGVALQSLLRNPLADPYVLGVSSGASVGVLVYLIFAAPLYAWALARGGWAVELVGQGATLTAIAGAIATSAAVFVLARAGGGGAGAGGGIDPLTLLLVGIVVSAINSALIMFLNAMAPHGLKVELMRYMMGTISESNTRDGLIIAGAIMAAAYLPLLMASNALNVASLSDVEAASLGVRIERLRTMSFVCSSLLTAVAIALAGPIGFVGLICPHICRLVLGPDHRQLMVAAPLVGAAFLMLADTFVRASAMMFYGQLPVGVITAICGGPFFLLLLKRRNLVGGDA